MQLLITRPRYDKGTHYLFHWSDILIEEAEKNGMHVIRLDKQKANRKKLHSYLSKQPTEIIVLNGHGAEDLVTGHDGEVILSSKDKLQFFKGKNIFIRACSSAAKLGYEIIKNGAQGFIGYTRPFIFIRDPDSLHRPLQDETAGPVLSCSNQVAISLIKGKSVKEAQETSMDMYNQKLIEYSSSKFDEAWILPFLKWNRDCQVCYSK